MWLPFPALRPSLDDDTGVVAARLGARCATGKTAVAEEAGAGYPTGPGMWKVLTA
ncbi:MAG: hypothetical protein ACK5JT_02895 [Hyphomicrobiaceae bacterium]